MYNEKTPLKSLIGILFAMSILCAATGCGAQETTSKQEASAPPSSPQAPAEESVPEPEPEPEPLPLMEPLKKHLLCSASG